MIRYFQHRFALSRKGAQDLAKGIAWTTVLNVGFMLPAIFTFLFLEDYLQGSATHGIWYYIALGGALRYSSLPIHKPVHQDIYRECQPPHRLG